MRKSQRAVNKGGGRVSRNLQQEAEGSPMLIQGSTLCPRSLQLQVLGLLPGNQLSAYSKMKDRAASVPTTSHYRAPSSSKTLKGMNYPP
ncbi:hypothetical protein XELAEV_18032287mg [Xenopus laevis]|uniref:Uncharacterized protein n=1 Tax=Xenopus laevis TaxID=8355 RepID=A0A974CPR0_XENLA|nr:hypothetical protein XELAEV_18032287mg [Xenopus laevis]